MLDLFETRCSVWFALCCIAHICMTGMTSYDFFSSDFSSLLSCFSGVSAKLSKHYYLNFPGKYSFFLSFSGWVFSGMLTDRTAKMNPPFPKICHTYPTMMKFNTVITYLTKIQNIYKSRDI